jgi:hypothetical protein
MEIIYKGTQYSTAIKSPRTISGARLYNLATQIHIDATLGSGTQGSDGMYTYNMSISPSQTASIPQGIYNLELFSTANGVTSIEAYYENYAKVKESSFTQQYS